MDFFVWQRTCVDDAGNVLASASVTVTDVVSGALAQLYSDHEGSVAIGNPITADSEGFVQFYVKAGFYNITATSGSRSRTWTREAIGAPHPRTADEISAGVTPVDYRFMPTPIRDISRYVSDNTGATDVRAQFQAAIDLEKNEIIVPDGIYLLGGTLHPKSGTGIFGNGQNTILKLADNADVPVIAFAGDDLDYVDVHLRGFAIDGNKSNQSSSDAHGISLTNAGGTSTLLARHRLQDLYIFNTKGDGLRLGFAMRSCHIKGIECYHCDGRGLHLSAHSDSIIEDIIVGQSGLQGVYVNGSGTVQLVNIKSWFSGRLGNTNGNGTGGTNGQGVLVRNTSVFVGRNILTQENEGHGLRIVGVGQTLVGPVVTGFVSDGDNKEGGNVAGATTWSALSMDTVAHAYIEGSVRRFSGAQGTVQYGAILSNVSESKIYLDIDPDAVLSWFVNATIDDDNDIVVNRSSRGVEFRGDTPATLMLGHNSYEQVWNTPLTVERAVTLNATQAWRGGRFRIVRTAEATGESALTVGTGPLISLNAGEWCEVTFSGSEWFVSAAGSLSLS